MRAQAPPPKHGLGEADLFTMAACVPLLKLVLRYWTYVGRGEIYPYFLACIRPYCHTAREASAHRRRRQWGLGSGSSARLTRRLRIRHAKRRGEAHGGGHGCLSPSPI